MASVSNKNMFCKNRVLSSTFFLIQSFRQKIHPLALLLQPIFVTFQSHVGHFSSFELSSRTVGVFTLPQDAGFAVLDLLHLEQHFGLGLGSATKRTVTAMKRRKIEADFLKTSTTCPFPNDPMNSNNVDHNVLRRWIMNWASPIFDA